MKHARSFLLAAFSFLLLMGSAACLVPMPFGRRAESGIYLQLVVRANASQMEQSVSQTMEVMKRRCDLMSIRCTLERQSGDKSDQVMLRASGAKDAARLKSVLLAEGSLEMRPVVTPQYPAPLKRYDTQDEATRAAGKDYDVLPYTAADAKGFVVVERKAIVTGRDLLSASAMPGVRADDYSIFFKLNSEGALKLGTWTSANIYHYIAVVLNGEARSVAFIKSEVRDAGQINGKFTKEQAEDTAQVLMSGSLPAPVAVLDEGAYKP